MLPWGHVLSMQELGQQRAELLGQGDAVRANHQEMEKKNHPKLVLSIFV